MTAAALGLALAALVGLSLGLLGGGGSTLTVPIFVYVLGFGVKEAIAMSLAVVGTTSLFGAARHWRAGNVDARVALSFGGVTMVGSFLGTRLAGYLGGSAQLAIFAVVVLVSATLMIRDRPPAARPMNVAEKTPPRTAAGLKAQENALALVGQIWWPNDRIRLLGIIALAGLAVGVLTGLVGVGGGFLIVPALVILASVPIKQAVGSSLLVISMNAASGFLGYLGQVAIHWPTVAAFTGIAVGGIFVGSALVRYISPITLRRSFAGFLLLMGVFILYQSRGVLAG